jgi:hypothetical protein
MKKTLFALPCMAALALAAFVGMKNMERNTNINETLLMTNVEALTEEEGTPVSKCYADNMQIDGTHDWVFVCNQKTSDEMIYPCPKEKNHISKGLSGLCKN